MPAFSPKSVFFLPQRTENLSLCRGIALHDAEYMTFGVLAVGEPTHSGDRHLGKDALPTLPVRLRDGLVEIFNGDRVHARLSGIVSRHQAAVDARFRIRSGRDQPV